MRMYCILLRGKRKNPGNKLREIGGDGKGNFPKFSPTTW